MNLFKKQYFFLFLIISTLIGCSFGQYEPTDCSNTAECHENFGWTAVCGEDGFCHEVEIPSACQIGISPEDSYDFYSKPDQYRNTIPIGIIIDGMMSPAELAAVQTAFEEEPKILEKSFVLLPCTSEQGIQAADDIVENIDFLANQIGVPAIIGGFDSETTLIAFNRLQELGLDTILFSPTSTSQRITTIENHEVGEPNDLEPGQLWRLVPNADIFGGAMGNYLVSEIEGTDTPTTVVLISESSQDSRALATVIREILDDNLSGQVVVEVENFETSLIENERVNSIQTALKNATDEEVDWLVVLSAQSLDYPTIMSLTETAGEMTTEEIATNYANARFLFPPVARAGTLERETALIGIQDHFTQDENGIPTVIGVAPYIDKDSYAYTSFSSLFNVIHDKQSAEQSGFSAQAYDSAWMLIYAIAWAYKEEGTIAAITGNTIGRGLRRLQDGNGYNVGEEDWNIARNELMTTGRIDLIGASGSLTFDLDTEEVEIPDTGYPMELWGLIRNGEEGCIPENDRDVQNCIISLGELP